MSVEQTEELETATSSNGVNSIGAAANGTEPLACVSCRSKKLKCDRIKPVCARCLKKGASCVYPEFRRKPAFKRRNVKELEARLAQVEEYLKEVNKAPEPVNDADGQSVDGDLPTADSQETEDFDFNTAIDTGHGLVSESATDHEPQSRSQAQMGDEFGNGTSFGFPEETKPFGTGVDSNDQLIGLGRSEALPPFEVMVELNDIFFESQHYYLPIIHPATYLRSFYGPPMMKPPMSLQYAIWAIASNVESKYQDLTDVFYRRAKTYANANEMKGSGEYHVDLRHAQAWCLITTFEAKKLLYSRAALSSARAVRLVNMLGLEKLDEEDSSQPSILDPPSGWSELEERRRTFWGAYAIDSHARISTGWPSLVQESDIFTRLPSSEEAFINGEEEETAFLEEIFDGATYKGFSGTIMLCFVYKLVLAHMHRTREADHPEDFNSGDFWNRHRDLTNKISCVFMFLPSKFILPQNLRDAAAIHTNLNLHGARISLHHAAIEQAEKYKLPGSVKAASLAQLESAADEIATIVKLSAHSVAMFKSPLAAMALYLAVTVYLYLAANDPAKFSETSKSHLELIVRAMEAVARHHAVTHAYLQSICHGLEGNDLGHVIRLPQLQKYRTLVLQGAASIIPLIARNAIFPRARSTSSVCGEWTVQDREINATGKAPQIQGAKKAPGLDRLLSGRCTKTMTSVADRNLQWQGRSWNRQGPISPVSTSESDQSQNSRENRAVKSRLWEGQPQMPTFGGMALPDRSTTSAKSSPMTFAYGLADNVAGGGDVISDDAVGPGIDMSASDYSYLGQFNATNRMNGMSSLNGLSLGLGNTPEENRIDLRDFQGRVATPLWPVNSTEDQIFGQITETVRSEVPTTNETSLFAFLNETAMDWNSSFNDSQRQ